jgi:molybdate transport system permease protein
VVTGYGLLWLLGRRGPVGSVLQEWLGVSLTFTTAGAVLAASVMALPLFVRAVRLGAEGVDPGLEEAARTLGASRWRALRTVTLPLALPGIAAGAALAFGRALGEFGATITFAGNIEGSTRTVPLALFGALQAPGGDATAARLAWVALALSLGAVVASEVLARWASRRVGR